MSETSIEETPVAAQAAEEAAQAEAPAVPSQVPQVPWMITVVAATRYLTPTPDGGCILHFIPGQQMPNGMIGLMPPRIDVPFSRDGWETFKREVANDGRVSPIVVAHGLPDLPPGLRR